MKLEKILLFGAGLLVLSRFIPTASGQRTGTASNVGKTISETPYTYSGRYFLPEGEGNVVVVEEYPSGARTESYVSAGEEFLRFVPSPTAIETGQSVNGAYVFPDTSQIKDEWITWGTPTESFYHQGFDVVTRYTQTFGHYIDGKLVGEEVRTW